MLQFRFQEGSGLEGHSFGNLFIVAMSGVVGNFEDAITESCRVLAVRGQVFPSTLEHVTLLARYEDEAMVRGESAIPSAGKPIKRLSLEPESVAPYPAAVRAIEEADLIIVGPGSVYTSLLPNLLVPGIAAAIQRSRAVKVYVCNVATQPGETDGFSVADHVNTLIQHVGPGLFQHVLVNRNLQRAIPTGGRIETVAQRGTLPARVQVAEADVVNNENPLRHDPIKLSDALMRLYRARAADIFEVLEPWMGTSSHEVVSTAVPSSLSGTNSEHS